MSKNILELLQDQIDDFEKSEESVKVQIPQKLIFQKVNFVFNMCHDFLVNLASKASNIYMDKPVKERMPKIRSLLKQMEESKIDPEEKISNEIDFLEHALGAYFWPANITLSFLKLEDDEDDENENFWEIPDEKGLEYIRSYFIRIFKSFLSENYILPKQKLDRYQHLVVIWVFYVALAIIKSIPAIMLVRVDFALARLTKEVTLFNIAGTLYEHERYRKQRGIVAKQKGKAKRKQPVIEEYFKIDKAGMRPHKIATTIEANLGKYRKDVPSVDTIKRYLKEENLI